MNPYRYGALLALIGSLAACGGAGHSLGDANRSTPVVEMNDAAANTVAGRIAGATNSFITFHAQPNSTRAIFGAPTERECVATVQYILREAGLNYVGAVRGDGAPLLDVDGFRAALRNDRKHWTRIDLRDNSQLAAAGDIWVQGDGHPGGHSGQNHVGICQDRACQHIVSNSSTDGSFTWSQTERGYDSYYAAHGFPYLTGAAYHHR